MKKFNRILIIIGIIVAYISIVYTTFNAVARVYRTNNPVLAKRVVILTFFVDICIFAGSGYLVYKLKFPTNKK